MHVCRFACSTHRFGGVESGPSFRVRSKTLRRWTRFETYCRNLHFDVRVPFRGFTLVQCKPGAAYQGLDRESMLVCKWQGLVPYFVTRIHVCRFSYSTYRFFCIESGPSFFERFRFEVDKLSNILSKSAPRGTSHERVLFGVSHQCGAGSEQSIKALTRNRC